MKPVSLVTTIFLALIALVHLLRILFQVELTAGHMLVPMWMSATASLFTAGMAFLLWKENRKS
jgi:hypothetical protein